MTDDQQHDLSRKVIHLRWHLNTFEDIAEQLEVSEETLTELRQTEPYIMQMWATYDRSPYIWNRKEKRRDCILHVSSFFGVSEAEAEKLIGYEWKPPEPVQLSLFRQQKKQPVN